MNNLGLFFQFGIRMQGGPAFLKRQRSAVGQPQTRTRTGSTSNQLQERTRSGSCASSSYSYWGYDLTPFSIPTGTSGPQCTSYLYSTYSNSNCNGISNPGSCHTTSYSTCYDMYGEWLTSFQGSCNPSIYCVGATTFGSCSHTGYGGWSNTSSCTPFTGGCNCNQITGRECRTISVCNYSSFTGWSNTSSCTPSNPSCSNGSVIRECQTIYSWGAWSDYEEVDVCISQSPALGVGAVQIECVPQ